MPRSTAADLPERVRARSCIETTFNDRGSSFVAALLLPAPKCRVTTDLPDVQVWASLPDGAAAAEHLVTVSVTGTQGTRGLGLGNV